MASKVAESRVNIDVARMAEKGVLAEWTGLEPATTGLTARYSNHLNYHSAMGAEGLEPPTFAV